MGLPEEPEYQPFDYACPDCGHEYSEANGIKKHPDHQVCPKCSVDDSLVKCGAGTSFTMGEQPFAYCTLKPNHKGFHKCIVEIKWPKSLVLLDGSVAMTLRYRISVDGNQYFSWGAKEIPGAINTPK